MPRRRLQLLCSSDDEEEENPQPQTHRVNIDEVLNEQPHDDDGGDEITDDIEIELQTVTLNSSRPHSTTNMNNTNNDNNPSEPVLLDISDDENNIASDSPISDSLRKLGLRLKREWLDSCLQGLANSVQGFSGLDVSRKGKLCFEQFLHSDMNKCGAGVLPPNVCNLHLVVLKGPYILQVDEIVNISAPLRGRYQNVTPGIKRCLKLSMTDGLQRVFGMEYRPIKDLEVLAPAGLKVAVCNVHVRHGLLMLVPEVFDVLGGKVEDLDAARQRLVIEVNKPPRGKRTRNGAVPPLATRATLAAWPTDSISIQRPNLNGSRTESAAPPDDVPALASRSLNSVGAPDTASASVQSMNGSRTESATHVQMDGLGYTIGIASADRTREENSIPVSKVGPEASSSSTAAMAVEEVQDEFDHPFILSGDRQIPFSYLASLSAMWDASKDKTSNVQGKIKCFLTGVKGFQFKQRATYDLRVYVDDGSLISEILIDHDVVQKGIGYSPQEVTAALTSSDIKRVGQMKETLKQFQTFLINFEGMILAEMNGSSPVPVATEMNQGCLVSDAWFLLKRLKPSTGEMQRHTHLEPIELSP